MAHHKVKAAELGDAGKIQTLSQMLYARNEPIVLRVLDGTLRFFTKVKGKPILWVLSRILGRFLPTAEVVTIKQATEFIDAISILEHAEIAVGPCRCQEVLGKRKGTYVKDLVVLYGAEAYKRASGEYRDVSPEEAKRLLQDLHREGMIQTFFACMRSRGWFFAICGCESEICFPFRAHQAAGGVLHAGPEIVALDSEGCTACGTCINSCYFGANSLNGTSEVEPAKCYGCGICVSTCASGARTMVKRQGYRNKYYPVDLVSSVFSGRQTSSIT